MRLIWSLRANLALGIYWLLLKVAPREISGRIAAMMTYAHNDVKSGKARFVRSFGNNEGPPPRKSNLIQ